MSDLTLCNYCNLRSIRERAKKDNMKVTTLRDAGWGLGGINVYVHSRNIDITSLKGGEDGERKKFRVAWLMELTSNCCC